MNRIIVDYKANEGDRVLIKNPRSKVGAREWGTVTHVEVGIRNDKTYYVHYSVILDRLNPKGYFMHVHIGEDGILHAQ